MAGRGDKIFYKQTEVEPDWEKLDKLFEARGAFPEGYEELRGSNITYELLLRWTRSAGVHGAKRYIMQAFHGLDIGKVMALRRAGWGVQDIADDMDADVEKVKEFLEKGGL